MYRTITSSFDYVTAPKEKDYIITEITPKPKENSPSAKATTTEPTTADSIKTNMVKGRFKVGKWYRFQVSGGIGVTTNDYSFNTATVTNNQLAITPQDQQVNFMIGLSTYPFQAFNLDNSFLGIKNKHVLAGRFKNRISIYTGIGIPQPLKNFYGGISFDLLPGVKITGGEHFIIYTKYQVTNNSIEDQTNAFHGAGPFISLNLDASFIGNVFGLFK